MPAKSQAQQRFMGMVHAEKEGTLDKSKLDPEFAKKIEEVAAKIKAKQARDLAETKHKGLPKKVKKKKLIGKKRVKWERKYDMKKTAKKELVYPIPVKQTPSPHLFWKPLMRKIFPDWGDDAVRTKGLGAQIERIVPFGKSGRHWPADTGERVTKVPGTKGWIQRTLPGGKPGFQLEKNSGLLDDTKDTIKDWYH